MKKVKIAIAGAAGYTGGELIRILQFHPHAELVSLISKSNPGKRVSSIHLDLNDDPGIEFVASLNKEVDVLFLCMGHGESKNFLENNQIDDKIKIIDLSNDFRLKVNSTFGSRHFIYGLPELNKEEIQQAKDIANPGCFATAIELGLLPLAKLGLLNSVYTTGITGSTGAGQSPGATSHFSWRANNIQAYKTLTHQHLGEIYNSLHQLQPSFPDSTNESIKEGKGIYFVPWRGDFARGIFTSSQLSSSLSLNEVYKVYSDFYSMHPFIHVRKEAIFLKQVVNTNNCFIQLEMEGQNLVIHTVIDNLLKGASGQAVQNMNLMFGFDEMEGLQLKANYF